MIVRAGFQFKKSKQLICSFILIFLLVFVFACSTFLAGSSKNNCLDFNDPEVKLFLSQVDNKLTYSDFNNFEQLGKILRFNYATELHKSHYIEKNVNTAGGYKLIQQTCNKMKVKSDSHELVIYGNKNGSIAVKINKNSNRNISLENCLIEAENIIYKYQIAGGKKIIEERKKINPPYNDPDIGPVFFLDCSKNKKILDNSLNIFLHEMLHEISTKERLINPIGEDFYLELPNSLPPVNIAQKTIPFANNKIVNKEVLNFIRLYIREGNNFFNLLDELNAYTQSMRTESSLISQMRYKVVYKDRKTRYSEQLPFFLFYTVNYLTMLKKDYDFYIRDFIDNEKNRSSIMRLLEAGEDEYKHFLLLNSCKECFEDYFWNEYIRFKKLLSQKVCSKENLDGCKGLGNIKKEQGNIGEAKSYYAKACNGGDMGGCINLGAIEMDKGNISEAKKFFIKACTGGNIGGCANLGVLEMKAGKKEEAKKLFAQVCDEGNMHGCYNFGVLENEKGNIPAARNLYTKACDAGEMIACNNLGTLEKDIGNAQEAKKLFTKACDAEAMEGCINLGLIEENQGNIENAKKLYAKVCNSGELRGCGTLGGIKYEQGNLAEAEELYKKACNGGNIGGCYNLACFYSMAKDKNKALTFFEKSLANGYNDWKHIDEDKDLDFIRNEQKYKTLLDKYKKK